MLCSQCKKKEANVQFNGVVNGKSIHLELCEDCAKKSNLTAPLMDFGMGGFFSAPFNFSSTGVPALNDLVDLLSSWHTKSVSAPINKNPCPACHWTMADFRKTGRMGCSECYLHFQEESQNVLKRIHGQTTHQGKKAPAEVAKTKVRDREKSLSRLKMDLEKAIRSEDFEAAALLRDKIRDFEKKSS